MFGGSPRKIFILFPVDFVISRVKNLLLGLTPEDFSKFEIFPGESSSLHRGTETGCIIKTLIWFALLFTNIFIYLFICLFINLFIFYSFIHLYLFIYLFLSLIFDERQMLRISLKSLCKRKNWSMQLTTWNSVYYLIYFKVHTYMFGSKNDTLKISHS